MVETWSKDEIFERLTEVLADSFEIEPGEIRLDSRIVEDLDLDSIDAIDLAVDLREWTGIELPEEGLKEIRIVQDIVDMIARRLPAE